MAPDDAARDLDETRRLLYIALACGRTEHHDLAGTLINALRHHQGVTDEVVGIPVLIRMLCDQRSYISR